MIKTFSNAWPFNHSFSTSILKLSDTYKHKKLRRKPKHVDRNYVCSGKIASSDRQRSVNPHAESIGENTE
jgi:hypothetical protein